MIIKWQTYRSSLTHAAEAVVDELWHRFRALNGLPVELVVVMPSERAEFELVVFTRSRRALTWVWLAYDCLTEAQRRLVRVTPYTLTEGKRDPVLADLLRAHLGWEKPELRHRRRRKLPAVVDL